jgi:uncharacterized protein (TIGR00299 family) protein
MPELHLDCPAGIAGDMFLAAMADLGLDLSLLEEAFRQAGVEVQVVAADAWDKGIRGKRLRVHWPKAQPLRHLTDLTGIVRALPFSAQVRSRAEAALVRLAEVEALAHGCPMEDVHFHEVGAVDTLVDVVGAFWALETLGVSRVTCSALPWFSGTVECAHGRMPLPAPATTILLQGKPVYPTGLEGELITPTGALLLDRMVDEFTKGPAGRLERTGLGLGTMDLPSVNGLRLLLLGDEGATLERIMVLETNVDHLTGEEIGGVFGVLLDAGALDVLFLPGVMKKNRPGGLLQVLCRPVDLDRIRELIFAQTMTLGLRMTETTRAVLPRLAAIRPTPWGDVPAKETTLDGQRYTRPEFEALQALAKRTGRSVTQLRYLLGED